jgi:hypothetical protein
VVTTDMSISDTPEMEPQLQHGEHVAASRTSAVNIPEFWTDEPALWFTRVEASFRNANVQSPSAKFDYVLMKLSPEVIKSVRDVIQHVPEPGEDIYASLKARLLGSYGPSVWKLANMLLDHPSLGEGRPSALMDSMLSLLPPDEKPGVVFQAMFLRRLPSDLRDHLASKKFSTPHEMAEYADVLWDARGGAASIVARVAAPGSPARGRRRSPGRSPSRRQQTPGPSGLCFYHQRFKTRAHKCVPPCTWAENGEAAGTN